MGTKSPYPLGEQVQNEGEQFKSGGGGRGGGGNTQRGQGGGVIVHVTDSIKAGQINTQRPFRRDVKIPHQVVCLYEAISSYS